MIANVKRLVVCVGLIAIAMGTGVATAGAADGDAPRVVTRRITPAYPDVARRIRASGKVKLSVLVTPEGKVKKVDVIGGHPLLVVAATEAARQWLFAPGPKESTESLIFDFNAPE